MLFDGIARSLKSAASDAVSMNGSFVVGKELHVDTGRRALHDRGRAETSNLRDHGESAHPEALQIGTDALCANAGRA
jgi:hypothetical protein